MQNTAVADAVITLLQKIFHESDRSPNAAEEWPYVNGSVIPGALRVIAQTNRQIGDEHMLMAKLILTSKIPAALLHVMASNKNLESLAIDLLLCWQECCPQSIGTLVSIETLQHSLSTLAATQNNKLVSALVQYFWNIIELPSKFQFTEIVATNSNLFSSLIKCWTKSLLNTSSSRDKEIRNSVTMILLLCMQHPLSSCIDEQSRTHKLPNILIKQLNNDKSQNQDTCIEDLDMQILLVQLLRSLFRLPDTSSVLMELGIVDLIVAKLKNTDRNYSIGQGFAIKAEYFQLYTEILNCASRYLRAGRVANIVTDILTSIVKDFKSISKSFHRGRCIFVQSICCFIMACVSYDPDLKSDFCSAKIMQPIFDCVECLQDPETRTSLVSAAAVLCYEYSDNKKDLGQVGGLAICVRLIR